MNKQAEELRKASDSEMMSLMEWNNLDYPEFEDAVVAKHRSLIKSDFNKTSYNAPSQTASVFLNFSDGYVDPDNSWLQFELKLAADEVATGGTPSLDFGNGSALNLIKSVVMTSRSGQEICRQDRNNHYQYRKIRWTHGKDEIETKLSAMGYGASGLNTTDADNQFCIPLKYLLGCFDPHDNVLLPNKLIAGARIDIEFEDNINAIKHGGAGVTTAPLKNSFSVENPTIFLDTINLSDNVLDRLNKRSAMMGKQKGDKGGLPLSWNTYDMTNFTLSSVGAVHVSAKKALSKAKMAHVALVKSDYAAPLNKYTADALKSSVITWTEYQYRLGNDYYPKVPVKGSAASQKESYQNALYAFSRMKNKPCAVRYDTQYYKRASPSDDDETYILAACNLESGQIGNLGGKLLSNGRSLDFNAKFANAGTLSSAAFDGYYFVDYSVRCRVFPSKISITE